MPPYSSPSTAKVWTQGHFSGSVRLSSDKCAKTKQTPHISHKGRGSNYIQLKLNSWLVWHEKIHITHLNNADSCRDKRWVECANVHQPPTPHPHPTSFVGNSSLPSVSIGKPWWLAAGFYKPAYMATFPCLHGPSAVTSNWARKHCQPHRSLIDTHEKSLLVLLTHGIIR